MSARIHDYQPRPEDAHMLNRGYVIVSLAALAWAGFVVIALGLVWAIGLVLS